MDTIDYIVIILGAIVLVLFFTLFITGRRIINNKIFKYSSFASVVVAIFSFWVINHMYEKKLNAEIEKFANIQKSRRNDLDSLLFTNERKYKLLDSLKNVEKELDNILTRIQQQEKIVGNKPYLVASVKSAIANTNNEICKIETYNEILNNGDYDNRRKGHVIKNTSNFTLISPSSININDDYLDFVVKFQDERLVDKIDVLYIEVDQKRDDGNTYHIFGQYYKPQKGINAFRVKNYLSLKGVVYNIGYFWKNEIGVKDYPTFERVIYP